MIDRDLLTIHQHGQLAIALYEGKVLAVALSTGWHEENVFVLMAGDTVGPRGEIRRGKLWEKKELHKLCV